MAKIDHHVHTSKHSPDSSIDPFELVERARAIGLDGIVITDHDYQWRADELAELQAEARGLTILSGAEVSAREGHFLVFGLPDLDEVPAGVTLRELLESVRVHNAAIVAAHPFRWGQDFDALVREHGPVFDSLELVSNNVTRETRRLTRALLANHEMGATGSSDGHDLEAVGCYFSEFPGTITTIGEFVAALRAKTNRPRHRLGAFLASGPVSA